MLARQTQILAIAETELALTLTAARRAFDDRNNEDDGGRLAVCAALNAVLKYMAETRPNREGQMLPLALLGTALAGLSVGSAPEPMLVPPKKAGRRRMALKQQPLQQFVAVAISILMDGGEDLATASAYVQRKLSKLGPKIRPDTAINWRSKVIERRPSGVGKPGTPDRVQPDLTRSDERFRIYLKFWLEWRRRKLKGTKAAKTFVDRMLNDKLKALL